MHRDLNDIIPPSRRRAMSGDPVAPLPKVDGFSRQAGARPASPQMEQGVSPASASFGTLRPPRSRRFPIGTASIALVVVLLSAGVLYAFAGAKVTIVPVTNMATVATDMSATAGQGDLPFQVVTVEKTVTASVPAESTIVANDPAEGKITITNKQTGPQALIKNTRFATPTGLIFRIHDSISIPAGGSLSVQVYADEPGVKYNIEPSTFTVPGLKGSKAFDLVTAKSETPMTGGFTGTRPTVADETKSKQYATMQTTLTAELEKELSAKIPADYVLVPGSSFPNYVPQTDTTSASGTVVLSEKGTIRAVIFHKEALARAIASKVIGTYSGQPVSLGPVHKLLLKPAEATLAPDATTFLFTMSGSVSIISTIDEEKIAGAIASKTRDSAELALQSFPEVDKATLVLRPFWANTFPADPKKIKVLVAEAASSK